MVSVMVIPASLIESANWRVDRVDPVDTDVSKSSPKSLE